MTTKGRQLVCLLGGFSSGAMLQFGALTFGPGIGVAMLVLALLLALVAAPVAMFVGLDDCRRKVA